MKMTNKHFAQLSIEQERRYLMFKALVELENTEPDIIEQKYLGAVSQQRDFPDATLRDLILYESNIDTDDDDEAFSEWLHDNPL